MKGGLPSSIIILTACTSPPPPPRGGGGGSSISGVGRCLILEGPNFFSVTCTCIHNVCTCLFLMCVKHKVEICA